MVKKLSAATPQWLIKEDALAKVNELPTVAPFENMKQFENEALLYIRKVERHAAKGSPVRRVLMLSRQSVFICTEQGEVKRMIPIPAIRQLRRGRASGRPQLLLEVPSDHDLLITFYEDKSPATAPTMDLFINIVQLIHEGWTSQRIPELNEEKDSRLMDVAKLKKPDDYENPKSRIALLEKLCRDHTPPMHVIPKTRVLNAASNPPGSPNNNAPAAGGGSGASNTSERGIVPLQQQQQQQQQSLPPTATNVPNNAPPPPTHRPPPQQQPQPQMMNPPPQMSHPSSSSGGPSMAPSMQQPSSSPQRVGGPSMADYADLRAELDFYRNKAMMLENMASRDSGNIGFHSGGDGTRAVVTELEEEMSAMRIQLECERQALQRVRGQARSERILAQLVTAICYDNTKRMMSKFETNYDELLKAKESSLDVAYTRVSELEELLYRNAGKIPLTELPPPMCLGKGTSSSLMSSGGGVPANIQEMPPHVQNVFRQYLSPNKVALLNQL